MRKIKPGDRFKNKFGVELVVRDVAPNGGAFMESLGSFAGLYSERELKKLTRILTEPLPLTENEEMVLRLSERFESEKKH